MTFFQFERMTKQKEDPGECTLPCVGPTEDLFYHVFFHPDFQRNNNTLIKQQQHPQELNSENDEDMGGDNNKNTKQQLKLEEESEQRDSDTDDEKKIEKMKKQNQQTAAAAPPPPWAKLVPTNGNDPNLIGRRVAKFFDTEIGTVLYVGKIMEFYPAAASDSDNNKADVWRVRYTDGDEEDYDATELAQCLYLWDQQTESIDNNDETKERNDVDTQYVEDENDYGCGDHVDVDDEEDYDTTPTKKAVPIRRSPRSPSAPTTKDAIRNRRSPLSPERLKSRRSSCVVFFDGDENENEEYSEYDQEQQQSRTRNKQQIKPQRLSSRVSSGAIVQIPSIAEKEDKGARVDFPNRGGWPCKHPEEDILKMVDEQQSALIKSNLVRHMNVFKALLPDEPPMDMFGQASIPYTTTSEDNGVANDQASSEAVGQEEEEEYQQQATDNFLTLRQHLEQEPPRLLQAAVEAHEQPPVQGGAQQPLQPQCPVVPPANVNPSMMQQPTPPYMMQQQQQPPDNLSWLLPSFPETLTRLMKYVEKTYINHSNSCVCWTLVKPRLYKVPPPATKIEGIFIRYPSHFIAKVLPVVTPAAMTVPTFGLFLRLMKSFQFELMIKRKKEKGNKPKNASAAPEDDCIYTFVHPHFQRNYNILKIPTTKLPTLPTTKDWDDSDYSIIKKQAPPLPGMSLLLPSFPEKLMQLMNHVENQYKNTFNACVCWARVRPQLYKPKRPFTKLDGILVRYATRFVQNVLPLFFDIPAFPRFEHFRTVMKSMKFEFIIERKKTKKLSKSTGNTVAYEDHFYHTFVHPEFQRNNNTIKMTSSATTIPITTKQQQQQQRGSNGETDDDTDGGSNNTKQQNQQLEEEREQREWDTDDENSNSRKKKENEEKFNEQKQQKTAGASSWAKLVPTNGNSPNLIGRRVAKFFDTEIGTVLNVGTIMDFYPAAASDSETHADDDPAVDLWRVKYTDGDEEDYGATELAQCLYAWEQHAKSFEDEGDDETKERNDAMIEDDENENDDGRVEDVDVHWTQQPQAAVEAQKQPQDQGVAQQPQAAVEAQKQPQAQGGAQQPRQPVVPPSNNNPLMMQQPDPPPPDMIQQQQPPPPDNLSWLLPSFPETLMRLMKYVEKNYNSAVCWTLVKPRLYNVPPQGTKFDGIFIRFPVHFISKLLPVVFPAARTVPTFDQFLRLMKSFQFEVIIQRKKEKGRKQPKQSSSAASPEDDFTYTFVHPHFQRHYSILKIPTTVLPTLPTTKDGDDSGDSIIKKQAAPLPDMSLLLPSFPEKLMHLMNHMENQYKRTSNACICWMRVRPQLYTPMKPATKLDGILVRHPTRFVQNVLPLFFNHAFLRFEYFCTMMKFLKFELIFTRKKGNTKLFKSTANTVAQEDHFYHTFIHPDFQRNNNTIKMTSSATTMPITTKQQQQQQRGSNGETDDDTDGGSNNNNTKQQQQQKIEEEPKQRESDTDDENSNNRKKKENKEKCNKQKQQKAAGAPPWSKLVPANGNNPNLIGRRVAKFFDTEIGTVLNVGTIIEFYPATVSDSETRADDDDDPTFDLWRVKYTDGDEEDYDATELAQCLYAWEQQPKEIDEDEDDDKTKERNNAKMENDDGRVENVNAHWTQQPQAAVEAQERPHAHGGDQRQPWCSSVPPFNNNPLMMQQPHLPPPFMMQQPHPPPPFMMQQPHPPPPFMMQQPYPALPFMMQQPHPPPPFMMQQPHPPPPFMMQQPHPLPSYNHTHQMAAHAQMKEQMYQQQQQQT